MISQPISRQSPPSEQLTTETVDGQPDRHHADHQSEPSRLRSPVHPRPASAPKTAPSSLNGRPVGRVQLAMTHFQGDFASGQRTRSVPVVVVGTFATLTNTSTYH